MYFVVVCFWVFWLGSRNITSLKVTLIRRETSIAVIWDINFVLPITYFAVFNTIS